MTERSRLLHFLRTGSASNPSQHCSTLRIDKDTTICVWDSITGQLVAALFSGDFYVTHSVVFLPDSQRIASASSDPMIRILDVTTTGSRLVHWRHLVDQFYQVLAGRAAHRMSLRDRSIQVWDATTGQLVAGPITGQTDWIRFVEFSPDGHRVRVASASVHTTGPRYRPLLYRTWSQGSRCTPNAILAEMPSIQASSMMQPES
jgi:WD40 repeat protein